MTALLVLTQQTNPKLKNNLRILDGLSVQEQAELHDQGIGTVSVNTVGSALGFHKGKSRVQLGNIEEDAAVFFVIFAGEQGYGKLNVG
jgi:hypothetical protein